MNAGLQCDVALSYSSEDAWLAKDFHGLLREGGFSVYCYDCEPDEAHGFLRTRLREIYGNSRLNLVIWSRSYAAKSAETQSFVAMERRQIVFRHVEKGEGESLFLILLDDSRPDHDFESLLGHRLQANGVLGLVKAILERLRKLYSHTTDYGRIHHPLGTEAKRGPLTPCCFKIDTSYQDDPKGRWGRYADVLVKYPNAAGTPYVYLIPSGLTAPFLRLTLRMTIEPGFLQMKRIATLKFAQEWCEREVKGYWFLMRFPEVEVATVYSPVYDRYLNDSLLNMAEPVATPGRGGE